MSLYIYDKDDGITDVVKCNDSYFETGRSIPDTSLVKNELNIIEKAYRASRYTFVGRDTEFGELNSVNLSTGTKTFLNIYKNPDVCFDVCECGVNVLEFMLKNLTVGTIFWHTPIIAVEDALCDVIYKGRHFDRISNFVDFAVYGDDSDESYN